MPKQIFFISHIMSKIVSSKIQLIRKSFEEALEDLESERSKLSAFQETVNRGLEYVEKRAKDFEKKEAELQELQLDLENGFKELDLKKKELAKNMENFKVREHKLRDKEKAIEVEREKIQKGMKKSQGIEEALQRRNVELYELAQKLLSSLETDELQAMESVLASRKKQRELGANILKLMFQEVDGTSNLQDDGEKETGKRKIGACDAGESLDIITKKRGRAESEERGQSASLSKTNDFRAIVSNKELSGSYSVIACHPTPQIYKFPAPEFYEFDKDWRKECFDVSQYWACYDSLDEMPRTYVTIMQVYVRGFVRKLTLHVTELVLDPEYANNHGIHKGLPSGCGRFMSQQPKIIKDAGKFSHRIVSGIRKVGGAYLIYPSKGQIWALFKCWVTGSSDSRDHKKFRYEIVVVLSDFVEGTGVRVAYLKKMVGYVSIFHRTKNDVSFMIRPEQMYRFSHQIPSYKMNGSEREGIPEGSSVLDPAAVPVDEVQERLCSFC